MSERYKAVEGSESGHCCFKATVVNTQTSNPSFCDELDWVCECFDMESAQKIADALNTAHLVGDVKYDTALFCDLKTDEEKSTFFLLGRGYETGVIAQAIQNDVAMAYHRCSEYRKELEALQVECEKLISALRRISYQASRHECRQTPTSDLQRAFADLMGQADDALYCFYNDGLPKQRFCEYAGCCEPAVEEALCHAHLKDWREQQAIVAAIKEENRAG